MHDIRISSLFRYATLTICVHAMLALVGLSAVSLSMCLAEEHQRQVCVCVCVNVSTLHVCQNILQWPMPVHFKLRTKS